MSTNTPLDQYRKLMPALDRYIYLNTAGSPPLPKPSYERLKEALDRIFEEGTGSPSVTAYLREGFEETRCKLASFLNTRPQNIALIRSVAEGYGMLASCYDWLKGDEVIISDQENPAGFLPWFALAKRYGIKIKELALNGDNDDLLNRLDALITSRTRFVSLSHVSHVCGFKIPLKEICTLVRSRGALTLVDGAQAAGQIPVDMEELGCDFYLLAGYKWLMGPKGVSGLFIRESLLDTLEPLAVGVGSQVSFDYENRRLTYKPSADKFEFGDRNLTVYMAFARSLELIQDLGVKNIQTRGRELFDQLSGHLQKMDGVEQVSPREPEKGSAILTFRSADVDHQAIVKALWEQYNVVAQWRFLNLRTKEQGIRISLAWFVSPEDVDRLCHYLKKLL
jgi:selenocysteine lyase/cysteine desulfurase